MSATASAALARLVGGGKAARGSKRVLGVKRPMLPHRQRPLPQRATRARATPLTHERVARASGVAECAAAAAGKAPSPAPTPKTQAGGLRASQAPHGAQPQPRRARARVGWRAGVGGAGALGPPRSALRVALSTECQLWHLHSESSHVLIICHVAPCLHVP